MLLFLVSFVMVSFLYAAEWFQSGRKFGPFGALFWLFLLQWGILLVGVIFVEYRLSENFPDSFRYIGTVLILFSVYTVGIQPIVTVIAVFVVAAFLAINLYRERKFSIDIPRKRKVE